MKLAVLGTGMIVQELLPVLQGMKLQPYAILGTERHRERALELAERFGIQECYFQYEALLDRDVDTIYIALPNSVHYSYARKALLHGKNVIVEKPITTNLQEFRELHDLANNSGRILLEAMTLHYLPSYRQMKQDLAQLGKIRVVNLNFSQYSSRYEAFLHGNIAPAFDPKKGGGALMDINIYNIHCLAGLFGVPESVHYCANIQNHIDTSGVLTLDYKDMTAVCIGAKDCQGPNISSIQGEFGRIDFSKPTNQIDSYEVVMRSGEKKIRSFCEGRHRLYYEFDAFSQIMDNNDSVRSEELLQISESAVQILNMARNSTIDK